MKTNKKLEINRYLTRAAEKKPMDIISYINRMNSIYGKSEPEEQHPQDKFHEEQIKEIEKRGKSWLVKHLNKQDQETEVQKLAEDIKRQKNKK